MNREQIENEAASYVEDILGLDYIGEAETERAFKAGAKWRINSVWHDKADVPEVNKEFLVELRNDDGNHEYWIEDYDKEYHALSNSGIDFEEVVRWAYIDDLLPERKEGEK